MPTTSANLISDVLCITVVAQQKLAVNADDDDNSDNDSEMVLSISNKVVVKYTFNSP